MRPITETLTIDGMSCGHCIAAVRHALNDIEGVTVGDVSIGSAEISYDADRVDRKEIERTVSEDGYTVQAWGER